MIGKRREGEEGAESLTLTDSSILCISTCSIRTTGCGESETERKRTKQRERERDVTTNWKTNHATGTKYIKTFATFLYYYMFVNVYLKHE